MLRASAIAVAAIMAVVPSASCLPAVRSTTTAAPEQIFPGKNMTGNNVIFFLAFIHFTHAKKDVARTYVPLAHTSCPFDANIFARALVILSVTILLAGLVKQATLLTAPAREPHPKRTQK